MFINTIQVLTQMCHFKLSYQFRHVHFWFSYFFIQKSPIQRADPTLVWFVWWSGNSSINRACLKLYFPPSLYTFWHFTTTYHKYCVFIGILCGVWYFNMAGPRQKKYYMNSNTTLLTRFSQNKQKYIQHTSPGNTK